MKMLEEPFYPELSHSTVFEDEDLTRRIPGCQSTNHREGYGKLWQCERCRKIICYNEGTDNDLGLCDNCWVLRHCTHQDDDVSDKNSGVLGKT